MPLLRRVFFLLTAVVAVAMALEVPAFQRGAVTPASIRRRRFTVRNKSRANPGCSQSPRFELLQSHRARTAKMHFATEIRHAAILLPAMPQNIREYGKRGTRRWPLRPQSADPGRGEGVGPQAEEAAGADREASEPGTGCMDRGPRRGD
jgi:hypothetical protein